MAINGSGIQDTARMLKISQNNRDSHIKDALYNQASRPKQAFKRTNLGRIDDRDGFIADLNRSRYSVILSQQGLLSVE